VNDPRRPIRALVVDYGEVLCKPPDPAALADMARVAGVQLERFTDAYWRLRGAYDRGELSGSAYWLAVAETVGARIDAALTSELVHRDIALWARVDEEMLSWVNAVAGSGVRVGLLSNMVAEIGAYLRDALRLFEGFSSVTYSYEVRLAKPDPRIYHHALASLGAAPHETLFVDDRGANVEAAQRIGMHVHHFRGREGLIAEIDDLYTLVSARP
jgi:putative hydrolase of the HAD superfamily